MKSLLNLIQMPLVVPRDFVKLIFERAFTHIAMHEFLLIPGLVVVFGEMNYSLARIMSSQNDISMLMVQIDNPHQDQLK